MHLILWISSRYHDLHMLVQTIIKKCCFHWLAGEYWKHIILVEIGMIIIICSLDECIQRKAAFDFVLWLIYIATETLIFHNLLCHNSVLPIEAWHLVLSISHMVTSTSKRARKLHWMRKHGAPRQAHVKRTSTSPAFSALISKDKDGDLQMRGICFC